MEQGKTTNIEWVIPNMGDGTQTPSASAEEASTSSPKSSSSWWWW